MLKTLTGILIGISLTTLTGAQAVTTSPDDWFNCQVALVVAQVACECVHSTRVGRFNATLRGCYDMWLKGAPAGRR